MQCSQILTTCLEGLHVDLILIKQVDIGFKGMFSDSHNRYVCSIWKSEIVCFVLFKCDGTFVIAVILSIGSTMT